MGCYLTTSTNEHSPAWLRCSKKTKFFVSFIYMSPCSTSRFWVGCLFASTLGTLSSGESRTVINSGTNASNDMRINMKNWSNGKRSPFVKLQAKIFPPTVGPIARRRATKLCPERKIVQNRMEPSPFTAPISLKCALFVISAITDEKVHWNLNGSKVLMYLRSKTSNCN